MLELMSMVTILLVKLDFDVRSAKVLRDGKACKSETFEINDLGHQTTGFWPGRSLDWKANIVGVDRVAVGQIYLNKDRIDLTRERFTG